MEKLTELINIIIISIIFPTPVLNCSRFTVNMRLESLLNPCPQGVGRKSKRGSKLLGIMRVEVARDNH